MRNLNLYVQCQKYRRPFVCVVTSNAQTSKYNKVSKLFRLRQNARVTNKKEHRKSCVHIFDKSNQSLLFMSDCFIGIKKFDWYKRNDAIDLLYTMEYR